MIAHSNDSKSYLDLCKKEVKELNLINKVFFIENVFGLEKLSLIKYSKAGILLSRSEGNPIFLQECIMLNKKIIASPDCNIEKNEFLIECNQICDLSKSIENLYSNE